MEPPDIYLIAIVTWLQVVDSMCHLMQRPYLIDLLPNYKVNWKYILVKSSKLTVGLPNLYNISAIQ